MNLILASGKRFDIRVRTLIHNRTLDRHWSAGREYQGVERIILKELGKITP